jgi:hypothetical protein
VKYITKSPRRVALNGSITFRKREYIILKGALGGVMESEKKIMVVL